MALFFITQSYTQRNQKQNEQTNRWYNVAVIPQVVSRKDETVNNEFNIVEQWPELFEGLSKDKKKSVINNLASSWHEGWKPNYEDVKLLTDYEKGLITEEDYIQLTLIAARNLEARNKK